MGIFKDKPLRRMYLRAFLNRTSRRSSNAEDKSNAGIALGDTEIFDTILDSLSSQYDAEASASIADGEVGGPFQDFLDWILANQDGILAFIKAIIALFSGL